MFAVMDAVTQVPAPVNEPVLDYAPGSPERAELQAALAELGSSRMDLPHVIGGKRVTGTGEKIEVRPPHAHHRVLGTMREATEAEAEAAVEAAMAAAPAWRRTCSPGHGEPGLSRQRCWASPRPAIRVRSTLPVS